MGRENLNSCVTATCLVKSWWAEIIVVTFLFIKAVKSAKTPSDLHDFGIVLLFNYIGAVFNS